MSQAVPAAATSSQPTPNKEVTVEEDTDKIDEFFLDPNRPKLIADLSEREALLFDEILLLRRFLQELSLRLVPDKVAHKPHEALLSGEFQFVLLQMLRSMMPRAKSLCGLGSIYMGLQLQVGTAVMLARKKLLAKQAATSQNGAVDAASCEHQKKRKTEEKPTDDGTTKDQEQE